MQCLIFVSNYLPGHTCKCKCEINSSVSQWFENVLNDIFSDSLGQKHGCIQSNICSSLPGPLDLRKGSFCGTFADQQSGKPCQRWVLLKSLFISVWLFYRYIYKQIYLFISVIIICLGGLRSLDLVVWSSWIGQG